MIRTLNGAFAIIINARHGKICQTLSMECRGLTFVVVRLKTMTHPLTGLQSDWRVQCEPCGLSPNKRRAPWAFVLNVIRQIWRFWT